MSQILVVDDSRSMVDYLCALLDEMGHTCIGITQPEQLFTQLQFQPFDLILLDIIMPGIDGLTLLKQIKKHLVFHSINVLIVSTVNDDHIIDQCLSHGATDVVNKPITDSILRARVCAALEKTQHAQTAEVLTQSRQNLAKSKDALTQSLARYNAIVNSSIDAILSIDEGGLLTSINPAAETLFGFHEYEIIGRNVSMLMPAPHQAAHDSYLNNYKDCGIPKIIGAGRELIARRKDGTTFPIHLTVSEISVDGSRGFAGIIRNLTDINNTQKRLSEISHLVQSSINEIYTFNSSTLQFQDVNPSAITNLGYSLQALRAMTPVDIKPEFTWESFNAIIEPLLDTTRTKMVFTTSHRRKDDSLYPVEVHLQLSEDSGTFIAIALDITERVQAAAALAKSQEQRAQSQKLESLGTLAGGIAHDFNNALAVITGSAELALESASDRNRKQIQRILKSSEKSSNLVKQILSFSRMDAENIKEAINLVEVINESIDMLRSVFPANITITTTLLKECPMMMGDSTQVQQIIVNLCTNAYHAMEHTGGVITLLLKRDASNFFLTISDSGPGIPLAVRPHIYDPFFTTKKSGKGTGLGLSIVYSIVARHGGEISLLRSKDGGAAFTVRLPLAKHCTTTSIAHPSSVSTVKEGHILIVDDEPDICEVYRECLEQAGYQVSVCGDGQEDLALFNESPHSFGAVLSDYSMPKMTGGELITKLLMIRPDLPIILASGFNDSVNEQSAKLLGACSYLPKPIPLSQLIQAIAHVMSPVE